MTGPLGFVLGNIEILGKQNSLFPSGPVIKCLLLPGYISKEFSFFHEHLTELLLLRMCFRKGPV